MSTLNAMQLFELVGNVDDELVAESLDFFCPVSGGTSVFTPAPKRQRRWMRTVAALGLAAAMLGGVVTAVPLLGGPDLWGGFYGVIAPLFSPDETETEESECEAETDEIQEPEESDASDENETSGKNEEPKETQKPEETGRTEQGTVPSSVWWPGSSGGYDPSPEWPTIDIREPRPQTPTAPIPGFTEPGPGPVRNPNLGG